MGALTELSDGNRERLMVHIDALAILAEDIAAGVPSAERRLAEESRFLSTALIPLMDAVESLVYPELDRLLSCRLAMTPMEREHAEVRRLIARVRRLGAAPRTEASATDLIEALRDLHGLITRHLADESSYARVLEHNVDVPMAESLATAMPQVPAVV